MTMLGTKPVGPPLQPSPHPATAHPATLPLPAQRDRPLPSANTILPQPEQPAIEALVPAIPITRPSKVGDATFAQAAAAASSTSLVESISPKRLPKSSSTSSSSPVPSRSHGNQSYRQSSKMDTVTNASQTSHLELSNGVGAQHRRTPMSLAISDTMASRSDGIQNPGYGRVDENLRKKEFIQRLLELVHVSARCSYVMLV